MAIARVLGPGVPEPGDEKVERRGALSPTEEARDHSASGAAASSEPSAAGSPSAALRLLALGGRLGRAAASASSISVMPRGIEQFASTVSGIVEVRDSLDGREIGEPDGVAHLERGNVCVDVLGHRGRQRLDAELACDLLNDAALLRAGRLADELDAHRRLDRAVEPHLVEVDVRERAADRMALELFEHRVVRRRLTLDHDVEDRVQARRPSERRAELALLHDDRTRVALAVEDSRNEPLLPQAAHTARADLIGRALRDL